METRKGTYQATWFIKQDLKKEKSELLESMRDMSVQYLGGAEDEFYVSWRNEFSARVDEINRILLAVDCGSYTLPEE